MENVNGCKYCSEDTYITEEFENDNMSVIYLIRPNGDLVGERYSYCWGSGECVTTYHVEDHFNFCPFCGRKF